MNEIIWPFVNSYMKFDTGNKEYICTGRSEHQISNYDLSIGKHERMKNEWMKYEW